MLSTKEARRQQAARRKAQEQRVYISGLEGHHSLEVGVAYFYRGHYVYAYPVGTPIVPVPFSTRNGIEMAGLLRDCAPVYDPRIPGLVPEASIAALHRAYAQEQLRQRQPEEEQNEQSESAATDAQPPSRQSGVESPAALPLLPQSSSNPPSSHTSPATLAGSSQWEPTSLANAAHTDIVQSPSISRLPPDNPQIFLEAHSFTPHDRAQFLAQSAPGSRHVSVPNTPYTSRPVSPAQGSLGVRNILRSSMSTSRLSHLFADEGIRRAFSPLHQVAEGRASRIVANSSGSKQETNYKPEYIDPDDITLFIETVSRPLSGLLSSANSSVASIVEGEGDSHQNLNLPGLGHTDEPRPHTPAMQLSYQDTGSSLHPYGLPRLDVTQWSSGTLSPNESLFLPGLGHSGQSYSQYDNEGPPSPDWPFSKPIGTGRPRKASIALNEAYNSANPFRPSDTTSAVKQVDNSREPYDSRSLSSLSSNGSADIPAEASTVRVLKCSIHSEECDGVTTTEKHLTERTRDMRGFKDSYPTIQAKDGRVMIDWAQLLKEGQAELGMKETWEV